MRPWPRAAAAIGILALAACGGSASPPASAEDAGAGSARADVPAATQAGEPAAAPDPDPEQALALERRARSRAEARVLELGRELAAERETRLAAETRIDELEHSLAAEETRRVQRELEWVEYNQAVGGLDLGKIQLDLLFRAQGLTPPGAEATPPEPEDPALAAARAAREARAQEIAVSLRALLRAEEVFGLDLLEIGALGDGFVGPVVFRLLDGYGRLAGSLAAERLRLQGSLSGHTLSLLLEDGYESHGGVRQPFADGARSILLPRVDPAPWIESFPELFGPDADGLLDDGSYDARQLRDTLNGLLALEAGDGYWRVRHVVGVVGDTLMQVHLSEYDRDGRLIRHAFADRLRIELAGKTVQLVLEDGVSMRGDEKTAFLDGRFRIYLPRAPLEPWRAADLPGSGSRRATSPAAEAASETSHLHGSPDPDESSPADASRSQARPAQG